MGTSNTLGSSAWLVLALFSSRWIFLAGGLLLCGIMYLGMADEVDVSESDDSVSEHEGLVSLSIIESSGAGVVVFLGEECSEKGLGSPWKGISIFLCRSLNLPEELSFSTLSTGISGIGCDLMIYGSAFHRSASLCFPCIPTFLTQTLSPGSRTA